jgi:glycosyltransferase involved in cell wall biosynthesis
MVKKMDITYKQLDGLKIKFNKIKKIIWDRTQSPSNFQIIQFTPYNPKNPYYTMIGDELIKMGFDFKYIDNFQKIKEIIGNKPTIIHFHQLSPFYHANTFKETSIKARQLLGNIKNLKDRGGKIVYTMHNPLPHNRIFTDIDKIINKEMYSLSNIIIVLGTSAKDIITKNQIINPKISVIKHVSFKEYYGKKPDKNQARKEIGLPSNAIIFGNIGSIKPYKGLEFIIKAFIKFSESQNNNKRFHLLIGGYSPDNEYITSLKEDYPNKNITIINKDLNNIELLKFISTLDYSVFAFKDIWASGSVILSISYKIPVIVPEIGCMPEYVEHSENGYLYKSKDLNGLIQAFGHAINTDNPIHLQQKCNTYNNEHTIRKSTQKFIQIYKQVINNEQPQQNLGK